jgi:hypothetical protein
MYVKLDHKNKKPRHVAEIHGTNFLHIKFSDRPNIKCQNGPVLPSAQVFYFNGQALCIIMAIYKNHQYVNKVSTMRSRLIFNLTVKFNITNITEPLFNNLFELFYLIIYNSCTSNPTQRNKSINKIKKDMLRNKASQKSCRWLIKLPTTLFFYFFITR